MLRILPPGKSALMRALLNLPGLFYKKRLPPNLRDSQF
jgi:hypothetical protein